MRACCLGSFEGKFCEFNGPRSATGGIAIGYNGAHADVVEPVDTQDLKS